MKKTSQIRARADAETKRRAEEILEEVGLNPSTAINMFYRQIILRGGLPFTAELPNAETLAAIAEARSGEGIVEAARLPELLAKLLTKRERTFDLADLVESDPGVLDLVRSGRAGD